MIKDVPLVGIFVNDQQAALEFYPGAIGALILDQDGSPILLKQKLRKR